jgi:hypothetical protein
MSQITNGLVNDGNTGHFSISYESSLSPADGRTVAQGLMNVIEGDLALIREWFAGTAFKYLFPINVELHNASGGAGWQTPPDISAPTYHPTIVVKGVFSGIEEAEQGLDFVRYLLVSEVTEMFMASKDNGWFENTTVFTAGDEGSKGEGMSRFLGRQFMLAKGIAGPYPSYDVVNRWLTSTTRPNYVEGSPDDHRPDIVTGGTTCFLYFLHDQLGFPIPSIIDAGHHPGGGLSEADGSHRRLGLLHWPGRHALPVRDFGGRHERRRHLPGGQPGRLERRRECRGRSIRAAVPEPRPGDASVRGGAAHQR